MHVAKAIIYDANGDILILRRSGTHPDYAYQSDLPGGVIDADEDIVLGLIREIEEETGLTVDPASLSVAFDHEIVVGDYIRHLYTVKLDSAKPTVAISWEHDQYEWLPPQDVLDKPTTKETDSYFTQALEWLTSHTVV